MVPKYTTTEKSVGETPLIALERLRTEHGLDPHIPLAYAGRLDPMASGKLLILVGDECKAQKKYHSLDKEYQVEILLGISSDSGDVLGLLSPVDHRSVTEVEIKKILKQFVGPITLPYPHFSSKTVKGKPLHTWALEKRLNEIEIPKKESMIYRLRFQGLKTLTKTEVLTTVRKKIETIPPVTDPQKALGADFRRDDVRASWNKLEQTGEDTYQILSFTCIASSGTYMRTLAECIAKELGTVGLAYSIHRTTIGKYFPLIASFGFWIKKF